MTRLNRFRILGFNRKKFFDLRVTIHFPEDEGKDVLGNRKTDRARKILFAAP
jgi:hypothetical protein